jgi:two-component system sensor histidine kinase QseC
MSRRWSLRNRLLALFTLATALAWAVSAAWLVRQARHEADVMFDASLVETAHVLLALAAHELGEHEGENRHAGEGLELPHVEHAHAERIFYQVRSPRGGIVVYSPGAPGAPLADAGERDLADHTIDGAAWRVYTLSDPASGVTIHVGEPAAWRDELARAALLRFAAPGLLLVLLLGAAAWWISARVVRPIERSARRIDTAAPGESVAPAAGELPREVEPLAQAIERLQRRVQQALLHERTLTADAAHELRTPLAALRAQAQWAQRAADESERRRALDATVIAADRCAALADAVLTLARLDAASFEAAAAPEVAVQDIVDLVTRDAGAAAAARGVTIETACAPLALRADPDALAVLLRNLIENAVRHAQRRVRLEVSAGEDIVIAVRDDGEGVPAEARARLFDRFYRVPGTSDAGGSGIGLALVKRLAELHGGGVATGEGVERRGLGIEVRLPRSLAR